MDKRNRTTLKENTKNDTKDIRYYISGETWVVGKNKTIINWPDGSRTIGASIEECISMLSLYEKWMEK